MKALEYIAEAANYVMACIGLTAAITFALLLPFWRRDNKKLGAEWIDEEWENDET